METRPCIKVLEESLCNQIAAGEVVERPASVVKELLENAIDAGADEIVVELESGGRRLIRVTDNGCGMNRQDCFLSLERHATSKIRNAEDLFALHTLGFRGEALASIASVSRFRLRSCSSEDGLGQEIRVEGGRVKNAEEVGMARGTLVEARNLFFNLPARRKFLRREQTELGHCADVVTKQALSHPGISFKLMHNDRSMLNLRAERGLPERVAALLGRALLGDMLEIENSDESANLRVWGLIGQPGLNRSATSHIYTFINGRYIRDRVIQHAVMEGYRHLLMKGRFPVVVIFIEITPDQVDVNVHPTKHEVRFREQSLVHDFIAASLREKLKPAAWVEPLAHEPVPRIAQAESQVGTAPVVQDSLVREPVPPEYQRPISSENSLNPVPIGSRSYVSDTVSNTNLNPPAGADVAETSQSYFANLKYLGQYHNSYLLCQDGSDLLLIDQHAAHERIGFERLKKSYLSGKVTQQALLFPEMLELDFRSGQALEDNLPALQRLGFEVEPFGGNSYALKAVPQLLADSDNRKLIIDIALDLDQTGSSGALEKKLDEVLILMACHSVIRANQALDVREARALLEQLDEVDFKANCPHGRPVSQRFSLVEIERMFRRQ